MTFSTDRIEGNSTRTRVSEADSKRSATPSRSKRRESQRVIKTTQNRIRQGLELTFDDAEGNTCAIRMRRKVIDGKRVRLEIESASDYHRITAEMNDGKATILVDVVDDDEDPQWDMSDRGGRQS